MPSTPGGPLPVWPANRAHAGPSCVEEVKAPGLTGARRSWPRASSREGWGRSKLARPQQPRRSLQAQPWLSRLEGWSQA